MSPVPCSAASTGWAELAGTTGSSWVASVTFWTVDGDAYTLGTVMSTITVWDKLGVGAGEVWEKEGASLTAALGEFR